MSWDPGRLPEECTGWEVVGRSSPRSGAARRRTPSLGWSKLRSTRETKRGWVSLGWRGGTEHPTLHPCCFCHLCTLASACPSQEPPHTPPAGPLLGVGDVTWSSEHLPGRMPYLMAMTSTLVDTTPTATHRRTDLYRWYSHTMRTTRQHRRTRCCHVQ